MEAPGDAPTPTRARMQYLYGAGAPNGEHPDWKDALLGLLLADAAYEIGGVHVGGRGYTWFVEFGLWMEFRGFWAGGGDAPGEPPALPDPASSQWGWSLFSGYAFEDPYDDGSGTQRVFPQGVELAVSRRPPGGAQVTGGDWSGPGFLFSWVQMPTHDIAQPPP